MFRLLSLTTTAIAALYVLEHTGIVKERAYFPTLPRLEAEGNTPSAWADAAAWGMAHLPKLSELSLPTLPTQSLHHGKLTDRVVAKDKNKS